MAVVWIVRAPAVKWPILNSLPSNSYYQLKAILNSVIRLKSPTESKKDNLSKPSQCIVHIFITVRSFFYYSSFSMNSGHSASILWGGNLDFF